MQWIRTGRKIGKAVRNAQRLRQIVSVLAKYGFADVVERMNLGRFLTKRLRDSTLLQGDLSTAERLVKVFEELGPTFVKLGQLLSTRQDILPDEYIQQFTQLQDNVRPVDFEIIQKVIDSELKGKSDEYFSLIDPKPLASASIAQVHEGILKTGEKVVLKVQRPEIQKTVQQDISLLSFIAELLEKYIPETRVLAPTVLVDEFFKTLNLELDFIVEMNNMRKIGQNLLEYPDVVIPKTYSHLTTKKLIVQEKLDGIRINDIHALDQAQVDRKHIVEMGAKVFFKTVLIDGLFHGDLHGGNLFVLPQNRIGLIDFGVVGRLSERSRSQFAAMVMALLSEDYEQLCYQYVDLSSATTSIDFEGFQREVRNTLSPYMGLSIQEVNMGQVLTEATRIATRYKVRIPGEWMLVFKAMLTIEGMGRSLDPHFDFISSGRELVKDLVKNNFSIDRLTKDILWIAKDTGQLLQTLPRQLKWWLRKLNSNDFAFEIRSPELLEIRDEIESHGKRITLSILAGSLFLASSIALQYKEGAQVFGYPLPAVIFLVIASFYLIRISLKR